MKRAVIHISEHVGNWVIEKIESIDQRAENNRGQLARIAVEKLDKIGLEKWLNMIGITSEDVRL